MTVQKKIIHFQVSITQNVSIKKGNYRGWRILVIQKQKIKLEIIKWSTTIFIKLFSPENSHLESDYFKSMSNEFVTSQATDDCRTTCINMLVKCTPVKLRFITQPSLRRGQFFSTIFISAFTPSNDFADNDQFYCEKQTFSYLCYRYSHFSLFMYLYS